MTPLNEIPSIVTEMKNEVKDLEAKVENQKSGMAHLREEFHQAREESPKKFDDQTKFLCHV